MLIMFCGLPGVGKTTVARLVASRLQATYIRIDTIEQVLRQAGAAGPIGPEGYLVGYAIAADNLALGRTVIADGVNAMDVTRTAWRRIAQEQGCGFLFVHLSCSDPGEHRRRLAQRTPEQPGHALPSWSAVSALPFAPPPDDALMLDTAQLGPEATADAVIHRRRTLTPSARPPRSR